MTRLSALLGLLLILTWIVLGVVLLDRSGPPRGERSDSLAQENARLRAELARHEAREEPHRSSTAPPTRDVPAPAAPELSYDNAVSQRWRLAILQLADDAARQAALREVEEALASPDGSVVLTALVAMQGTERVTFDQERIRQSVRRHLEAKEGRLRAAAYAALACLAPDATDLPAVERGVKDPASSVRGTVSGLLTALNRGEVSDADSTRVLLALLGDSEQEVVLASVRGLAMASRLSDEVEQALIALGEREEARSWVYEGVLATLMPKSERVTDALLAAAQGPDERLRGRMIHFLRFGVPPTRHATVADAMLRVAALVRSHSQQRTCVEIVGLYGNASHLPALDGLAAREDMSRAVRHAAEEASAQIRQRGRR